MSGYAYRVPAYPIAPGDTPPVEDMQIATAWQVKSLITRPEPYLERSENMPIKVRGHAVGRGKSNREGCYFNGFRYPMAGDSINTAVE